MSRLKKLRRLRLQDFLGSIEDLAVLREVTSLRELEIVGMPYAGLGSDALQDRMQKDLRGVSVRISR